jgi:hypothetical protein
LASSISCASAAGFGAGDGFYTSFLIGSFFSTGFG